MAKIPERLRDGALAIVLVRTAACGTWSARTSSARPTYTRADSVIVSAAAKKGSLTSLASHVRYSMRRCPGSRSVALAAAGCRLAHRSNGPCSPVD